MAIVYTDIPDPEKSKVLIQINLNRTRNFITDLKSGVDALEYMKGFEEGLQKEDSASSQKSTHTINKPKSWEKGYKDGINTAHMIMGRI